MRGCFSISVCSLLPRLVEVVHLRFEKLNSSNVRQCEAILKDLITEFASECAKCVFLELDARFLNFQTQPDLVSEQNQCVVTFFKLSLLVTGKPVAIARPKFLECGQSLTVLAFHHVLLLLLLVLLVRATVADQSCVAGVNREHLDLTRWKFLFFRKFALGTCGLSVLVQTSLDLGVEPCEVLADLIERTLARDLTSGRHRGKTTGAQRLDIVDLLQMRLAWHNYLPSSR